MTASYTRPAGIAAVLAAVAGAASQAPPGVLSADDSPSGGSVSPSPGEAGSGAQEAHSHSGRPYRVDCAICSPELHQGCGCVRRQGVTRG